MYGQIRGRRSGLRTKGANPRLHRLSLEIWLKHDDRPLFSLVLATHLRPIGDDMNLDCDVNLEPDAAVNNAFAASESISRKLSSELTSTRHHSQLYQIKTEPESPAKLAPSTRRSTRMRRVTVKQELLGSCGKLPVAEVKRQVVKKAKTLKTKRGYAPPEQYAHLQSLPEFLREDLDSELILHDN